MSEVVDTLVKVFEKHGSGRYGAEMVTQLQHALQTAMLAEAASAPQSLIVAALLHDVGHIFEDGVSENHGMEGNLDDRHEYRANVWLKRHFGTEVADPIRLHVQAKRYLCSKDADYVNALSPTSHQSYLDQGGPMSIEEMETFESEPEFQSALKLRRWDDQAKDPDQPTDSLEHFLPYLEGQLRESHDPDFHDSREQ